VSNVRSAENYVTLCSNLRRAAESMVCIIYSRSLHVRNVSC
jgi:hypothetical protein